MKKTLLLFSAALVVLSLSSFKTMQEYLSLPQWVTVEALTVSGMGQNSTWPTATPTNVLGVGSNGDVVKMPIPTGATFLSNVTLTQSAPLVLLGAGVRKATITGVTGLLAGDRVVLTPTASTPTGYAIGDCVATANGTLEVSFTAPALAIGASFSIPCKVTVFR